MKRWPLTTIIVITTLIFINLPVLMDSQKVEIGMAK